MEMAQEMLALMMLMAIVSIENIVGCFYYGPNNTIFLFSSTGFMMKR
jgi:hypothetical protein